ncbi:hypothetical protein [Acinetobacter indicus]|uniref:hypothetical protein n=1 Tax=Acinetobacter indicus TaxID=756892 RepID=UPI00143FE6F6|nr:hypothetical protein [Acinetobacter indicus]MDM1290573.1 hypothetical protein [Acinetobacter indicus]MDM1320679.1 hypothetical protein [Acinetobacter indicus]MDM1332411.1 hypothetical protein [Acinetobacter indicus]QIZ59668.1 hypothetical protein FK537_11365 [Acinetobacter indicus]
MTTYNESQTFCEIENFIQAILTNQISVEQFKQQIIPLIKKSRRFFVDGNNYIAAIIVFKHLEQIIFKANAFKFYDSIQDLPDHVVEGFIKYVQDQAGLIEADYQYDQNEYKKQVKKAERFLSECIQQQDQLTIFPIYLSIKPEVLSVIRLYDLDLYLSAFLKLIRSRDTELFRSIHSVIWQIKHDPEQGYYVQLFCIYAGQAQAVTLTDHARRIGEQWLDVTNGYGVVSFEEHDLKGISVNCLDDKQIQRALQVIKARMNNHARNHYLRVTRHRRKTFDCQRIGLSLV